MKLNTIQISILKKLSKEANLDVDHYIYTYSEKFLAVRKSSLTELSEEDGDIWINKAYVDSLKNVKF